MKKLVMLLIILNNTVLPMYEFFETSGRLIKNNFSPGIGLSLCISVGANTYYYRTEKDKNNDLRDLQEKMINNPSKYTIRMTEKC